MQDEIYYSRRSSKWTKNFRFGLFFLILAGTFYIFNHWIARIYRLQDSYCKEIPVNSYVFSTFYYPFWGIVPQKDDLVFADILGEPSLSMANLVEFLSLGAVKADTWRDPKVVSQRVYRIIAVPGDIVWVEEGAQLFIRSAKSSQIKMYQLPEFSPQFFNMFVQKEIILPQEEYLAYLSGTNSLTAVHTFHLLKLKDIVAQVRFYF